MEEDQLVKIINIAHLYYLTVFQKESEHMFANIDYSDETSTNRSLELLYEAKYTYDQNLKKSQDYIDIYYPDDDTFDEKMYDEIFGITLEDKITYISPTLYSLFVFLSEQDYTKLNWKIIQVKSKSI
jgi:hypothetical protein